MTLADERGLLEQARTALGRREPEAALRAVEQHLRQFPQGQLAEEREVLWIQALVNLGDLRKADDRARRFRARYPDSILLPAVEGAITGVGK